MDSLILGGTALQKILAVLALCALILALYVADVNAQAAAMGTITINKVISGTTTVPATNFSFLLNGAGTTTFDVDASNNVQVATGTSYNVTEVAATGFVTSYSNCDNIVLATATSTATCTITNTATTTGTGGNGATTGTLIVKKDVTGGNGATSSFSFLVNGINATAFEADGMNSMQGMATGTYSITEVPAANYTPTYSNCASVSVTAGATTTCTITNNFNIGGQTLYEIDGFKWNDDNRNGLFDNNESVLAGWTISANAQGELTRTDITDVNGRYSLMVPSGMWTVTETVQSGWEQIFPASNAGHSVAFSTTSTTTADLNFGNDEVQSSGGGGGGGGGGGSSTRPSCELFEISDENGDEFTLSWETTRGSEITIDEDGDEIYSSDDDDITDEGSLEVTPPNGDTEYELTVTRGSRSDTCTVTVDDNDGSSNNDDDDDSDTQGQVLGEQTSVLPFGAPNTGVGGGDLQKMDDGAHLPLLGTVLLLLIGFGVARAVRDEEETI